MSCDEKTGKLRRKEVDGIESTGEKEERKTYEKDKAKDDI